ncbi:MAG: hypothetical protein JO301_01985 [Chitinophagaceae bacterium]|nr:hypothetical protein [Chitinophagaceae bacterium]
MDLNLFRQSLTADHPPALSVHLLALWYDARGDWNAAHDLIDDMDGQKAAWIHAYLHRKEGDAGNARYWYNRADKPVCKLPLEKEWEEIVKAML